MKTLSIYLTVLAAIMFPQITLSGQMIDKQIERARQLQRTYDFEKARNIYRGLLSGADSTLSARVQPYLLECENGLNMVRFATIPTVVAVKEVEESDFYLWYSHLSDRCWIPMPNPFVEGNGCGVYNSVYFKPERSRLIFSAPDENGSWDLMYSEKLSDTLWSAPLPLGGFVNSQKNDIMPVLSKDGQSLYFSSDGLAGMGGYDIYVCRKAADGRSWSAPRNLGFPYSSPYDDFLYCDTPDGQFSIFASNRDSKKGFIKIYVLAFENQPVPKSLTSVEDIRKVAALSPYRAKKVEKSENTVSSDEEEKFPGYFKTVRNLSRIKDSLENSATDEEYLSLQARIHEVQEALGKMEMQMLAEGVVPPTVNQRSETAPVEEAQASPAYTFRKNAPGALENVTVEAPVEEVVYAFSIEKLSSVVKGNALPQGICYQVQLCTVSNTLAAKRFKGITPVFEVKQKSGKYIYYAGVFETYAEATAAQAKIKKLGFSPITVAWRDGRSCALKTARAMENKK